MKCRVKDILSLTLTLGCKNVKQPSGPIELDLESGNLVSTKEHLSQQACVTLNNYKLVYYFNFLLVEFDFRVAVFINHQN